MDKIKNVILCIAAAVTGWLGILAVPIYILVVCNLFDYLTGIVAAKNRGKEVSSYFGMIMIGIVKKVFMYILVIIGVFVDIMLNFIASQFGEAIGVHAHKSYVVGALVATWLVLNEFISIMENLNDIGVPMPPFLQPIISRLKKQVEKEEGKDED